MLSDGDLKTVLGTRSLELQNILHTINSLLTGSGGLCPFPDGNSSPGSSESRCGAPWFQSCWLPLLPLWPWLTLQWEPLPTGLSKLWFQLLSRLELVGPGTRLYSPFTHCTVGFWANSGCEHSLLLHLPVLSLSPTSKLLTSILGDWRQLGRLEDTNWS